MMSLVVAHARRCNTALRVICNCTGFGGSFPQSAARHRASACLQAAYFGTQAALHQPSTQPFNCHPRRRGLPPLIGRPNQEASAPQPRSMLCTPWAEFRFLAPPHINPAASPPRAVFHHTIFFRMRPESRLREIRLSIFTFIQHLGATHGRILYHHLGSTDI
jgi:hypothetical protein